MTSLAGLEAPGGVDLCLSNLPCLGSRSIIAGWYSVVDDALRAGDHTKVLKLYEAALCIPLRLRLGPSMVQVTLDSITYSEDLFAAHSANSDSFMTFAEKVMVALPPGFLGSTSVTNIVIRTTNLGISFHGSAVGDNTARALTYVSPLLKSLELKSELRAFEETSAALDDVTNKLSLLHACTKAYGKAGGAATEASVALVFALRSSLVYKDIAKDQMYTKEFLIGGKCKSGFAHWFFKRTVLADFIKVLVASSNGRFSKEAEEKISPNIGTFMQMEKLAGRFTQAGSGNEAIRRIDRPGNFLKQSSAVGEVDSLAIGEVDEGETVSGDVADVGILSVTLKVFGAFTDKLSSSGQLLARILWKIHGGVFDDDFRLISNAEFSNSSYVFPFWRSFQPFIVVDK